MKSDFARQQQTRRQEIWDRLQVIFIRQKNVKWDAAEPLSLELFGDEEQAAIASVTAHQKAKAALNIILSITCMLGYAQAKNPELRDYVRRVAKKRECKIEVAAEAVLATCESLIKCAEILVSEAEAALTGATRKGTPLARVRCDKD